MKLTENFTLEELISSSTAKIKHIDNTPDSVQLANLQRLCVEILQPIRDRMCGPVTITSGFRSKRLNKAVRGVPTSQHTTGEAADIISGDNKKLWDVICRLVCEGIITVGQLIDEKNLKWIHISLPNDKHRNQILRIP